MRLSRREGFFAAVSVMLLAYVVFGPNNLSEARARDAEQDLFKELKIFTDVISVIQRDYVREVASKKLVEGAIKGMLATLDPHSGYLDPDFYQDLQVQTKGEFGGLGIEITIKEGALIVVTPMEGSPAEIAGIRAGDSIVKIEGKFTKEFTLVDAVKKMRGPKGSPIQLSVQRKGLRDLLDVTVVRDNITVKSVKGRYLEDGFGLVRLSQFMEHSVDDLKAAIQKIRNKSPAKELSGLILDLRNNPGGLLTQAVAIGDLFLTEGMIVYTDGRLKQQKQEFFAHSRGTEPGYPIIVLVNGGSASASEIVAGALKDHGRALVLGTQTFGKGSVQTITPLENGGGLTLTTALYYTKSGRSLQALGVTPDIIVNEEAMPEKSAEQVRPRIELHEGDLPGAIENPSVRPGLEDGSPTLDDLNPMKKLNKIGNEKMESGPLDIEKTDLAELLKHDVQLRRAYDLIRSYDIFKGSK